MAQITKTLNNRLTVILDKEDGSEVVRPSCANSHLFCELAGTKTLSKHAIDTLKKLGYVFDVKCFESQEFEF